MLDYAQESRRAGRDGGRSEAVIINNSSEEGVERELQSLVEEQYAKEQKELVWGFLKERCRRIILGEYLDRIKRESCKEGEEKYNIYEGVRPSFEEAVD
jgi:superfamily II DNA helicase RecQ